MVGSRNKKEAETAVYFICSYPAFSDWSAFAQVLSLIILREVRKNLRLSQVGNWLNRRSWEQYNGPKGT